MTTQVDMRQYLSPVPIILLDRDLREAAATLSDQEARYLVDAYYMMQDDRKRAHNQVRALGESVEPHSLIVWLAENSQRIENNIKIALGRYAASKPVGVWSSSIVGIGPVISAGLIAHIDLDRCNSASNIWSFAGMAGDDASPWVSRDTARGYIRGIREMVDSPGAALYRVAVGYHHRPLHLLAAMSTEKKPIHVPTQAEQDATFAAIGGDPDIMRQSRRDHPWYDDTAIRYALEGADIDPDDYYGQLLAKVNIDFGELAATLSKRPWNASLKTLCWKIGESFVKTSGNRGSFYGPHYVRWKNDEVERNERGEFASQAEHALKTKNFGRDTEARRWYEQGKLPPAHVHARAKRKVVKLFLGHWFEVAYHARHGQPCPVRPYVIDHLGHKDYIAPPNWP